MHGDNGSVIGVVEKRGILTKPNEAIVKKVITKETKEQPLTASYHYHEGVDCYLHSKHREAIENFKKAVELDPTFADAHYYMGLVYAQNKMYNEAINCYTEVIKLIQNPMNAYYYRGEAYMSTGEKERADNDFKEANALRMAKALGSI